MKRVVRSISGALVCLLFAACGSREEQPDPESGGAAKTDVAVAATATPSGSTAADGPLAQWDAPEALSDSKPAYPFNHAFAVPPPDPAPDPDAAIDRYIKECPAGSNTPACHDLKLAVEGAFLDVLVDLRGTTDIDPEWYRIAATAETPQLACLAVGELVYLPGRTPADEALVVKALDSPWRSVRNAALTHGQKIGGVGEFIQRADGTSRGGSQTCIDNERDAQPGPEWAGNYPGAKFRAFASNPDRRWFTTSDPVEKVIAYFAAQGKPARTHEEMAADASAKMVEEMTRLSSSPDAENAQEKMMELMQGLAGGVDWSAGLRDLRDVGEVRIVMLTEGQGVAVFKDDIFKGTSIVAPRPPLKATLTPDLEEAKRQAAARSILGY